jgi:hypothetical protein
MLKSYTDDLASWVETRSAKKRRRDEAAVAFLAVKEKVVEALESGYALSTIWEHMSDTGMVKFSYETFRAHARRYIKVRAGDALPEHAPAASAKSSAVTAQQLRRTQQGGNAAKPTSDAQATSTEKPDRISGFTFNSNPDKKDLL